MTIIFLSRHNYDRKHTGTREKKEDPTRSSSKMNKPNLKSKLPEVFSALS
jgi:hypothetical protein